MTDAATSYRLFRMNALTGDINSVEQFDAWNDDEAIGRALEAAGDHRIELWCEGRKLVAISGRNGPVELRISRAARPDYLSCAAGPAGVSSGTDMTGRL